MNQDQEQRFQTRARLLAAALSGLYPELGLQLLSVVESPKVCTGGRHAHARLKMRSPVLMTEPEFESLLARVYEGPVDLVGLLRQFTVHATISLTDEPSRLLRGWLMDSEGVLLPPK